MSAQNNSQETTVAETPIRRNVDIGVFLEPLEKAATEDSFVIGNLYTIPEFTREILNQFLRIREYHRVNDKPLLTPEQIADIIISKT